MSGFNHTNSSLENVCFKLSGRRKKICDFLSLIKYCYVKNLYHYVSFYKIHYRYSHHSIDHCNDFTVTCSLTRDDNVL